MAILRSPAYLALLLPLIGAPTCPSASHEKAGTFIYNGQTYQMWRTDLGAPYVSVGGQRVDCAGPFGGLEAKCRYAVIRAQQQGAQESGHTH